MKLCKDCKHFLKPPTLTGQPSLKEMADYGQCARVPNVSPVSGMQTVTTYCHREREDDGTGWMFRKCGPKGKYWVQA